MFLLVAVLVVAIRTVSAAHPLEPGLTGRQRLTAGITYVSGHSLVLGAITLDLFAVLLGGATALLPSMRAISCTPARPVSGCCAARPPRAPRLSGFC